MSLFVMNMIYNKDPINHCSKNIKYAYIKKMG